MMYNPYEGSQNTKHLKFGAFKRKLGASHGQIHCSS